MSAANACGPEGTLRGDDPAPGSAYGTTRPLNHLPSAGLVAVVGLAVLPPLTVVVWTLLMTVAVAIETAVARGRIGGLLPAGLLKRISPLAATVLTSLLYAAAGAALIVKGGGGARMFSFALMVSSMLFVLLKFYRRPVAFLAGIAPQGLVLLLIGVGLVRAAASGGNYLAALTPLATFALMFGLFWVARAHMATAATALIRATEHAQERERAASAANTAKSEFLATMSHEIRTPLNGVLGMAQAMTAEELGDTQRERLTIIRRSGETLLAIIDDILDLSKIEAGRFELEEGAFELEPLVRGAIATFAPIAQQKGVDFDLHVEAGVRGVYRGDATRIRQLLYNLISNAVKFTPAGRIDVRIGQDERGLRLMVADTGVGIAPEHLPRLFDKFVQVDSSATRQFGGSGLGLTICQQLTQLMGGAIEVSSVKGEGSTFEVILPLQPLTSQETDPAEPSQEAGSAEGLPLRVLAAEDNSVNQMVLKTLLQLAGIEPVITENGVEVLAAWQQQEWHVILMDIQMPQMDGLTATRAIRAREAETGRRRTPIIAVTANVMAHQVSAYEAAGMDQVVPKPLEAVRLFAALDSVGHGAEQPEQTGGDATSRSEAAGR